MIAGRFACSWPGLPESQLRALGHPMRPRSSAKRGSISLSQNPMISAISSPLTWPTSNGPIIESLLAQLGDQPDYPSAYGLTETIAELYPTEQERTQIRQTLHTMAASSDDGFRGWKAGRGDSFGVRNLMTAAVGPGPTGADSAHFQRVLLAVIGPRENGSPYLTGVPLIRPLRPARPDPVGRPYGALAAAPLLVTFRDRLRRGSFLACRAARVVGCSPSSPADAVPARTLYPPPFACLPADAPPGFNRVFHFCALRAGELGAACPHFHESACELL